MAGVVQTDYSCSDVAWASVVETVKAAFTVEHEDVDSLGRVCFLRLKRSVSDEAGVMLDVVRREAADGPSNDVAVSMHWSDRSPGKDRNASRKLAAEVDELLKSHCATCRHSPIEDDR